MGSCPHEVDLPIPPDCRLRSRPGCLRGLSQPQGNPRSLLYCSTVPDSSPRPFQGTSKSGDHPPLATELLAPQTSSPSPAGAVTRCLRFLPSRRPPSCELPFPHFLRLFPISRFTGRISLSFSTFSLFRILTTFREPYQRKTGTHRRFCLT